MTRAWLQKLHTYFTLNPKMEDDTIRFTTLHLDDLAYDWWQHSMTTKEEELTLYLQVALGA